ncbi:MAG: type II secretion system F family protein [Lachnospiraceae bacterium]|nr:type II secretion system F family protein [Lachnospiraceae bacterium]
MPDYRNYWPSLREWVQYGSLGLLGAVTLAGLFYRSVAALCLLLPVGLCLPLALRGTLAAGRRRQLASQFRDGALAVASALSVGYSAENAWAEAAEEMAVVYGEEGMITQEFRGICRKLALNQNAEEAVEDLARRSGVPEIEQFAQVYGAAKRSSGDLAPILRDTAAILSKRIRLQEEISSLVAAKRLEFAIMSLMPAGILVYINLGSPGFTDPLYQSLAGRVVMTACLGLYALAVWLGLKILSVEV